MPSIELSDDEIQTIRHLIDDWGFKYVLTAEREKVDALAKKLGPRRIIGNLAASTMSVGEGISAARVWLKDQP